MSILRPGRIIKAEIVDPNGFEKKRLAVIASQVPANDDGFIVVFAITSQFTVPVPPMEIFLQADPEGKSGTLMKKDCVVACWWPRVIRRSDILECYGELSAPQIRIMAHFFKSLNLTLPEKSNS